MNGVYEELDEAKAEIEKLKEQCRIKAELAESLKRAHNDHLSKNKEASLKLEKLAHELNQKDDEISNAREMYDELKSIVAEKESIVRHLSSSHDKLRFDCSEKLKKVGDENKALASALDDANAKNFDQEQKIRALKQEIEGVKRLLTFSERKCSESESKTKAKNESEAREDDFLKLDLEKRKFEDRLKWKNEQFVHLEEAHKKLRNEFKTKEREWEKEKISLLDAISSLETKLESQTRFSQDLERRLETCNVALAHAESKRKSLEAQLLESRTSFDSFCAEYDDAKLYFESTNAQRDQEVAALRSSLGTREILHKEMGYRFEKLEQEKQELMVSLKELQENQIREAGFSFSSSKLQNKLKSLEKAHKGCSTNLKAKEIEWRARMGELSEELNSCRLELKDRDASIDELSRELEACKNLKNKLVQENANMRDEVERLKGVLEESRMCHVRTEEQVVWIRSELREVHDDLDRANEELYESFCEANETEFELQVWKSVAEQMEASLKRNLQMRREVEASLFAQMEVEMSLKQERENLSRRLEEREKQIDHLRQQLVDIKTARNAQENEALARVEAENDETTLETMNSKTAENEEENEASARLEPKNDENTHGPISSRTAQNAKENGASARVEAENDETTPETMNSKTAQNEEENEASARVEAENNENTPDLISSRTAQNAEENEASARVGAENDENTPNTINLKTAQNAENGASGLLEAGNDENSPDMMNSGTAQNAGENEAIARDEAENDENTPEAAVRIYQLVEERDQRICALQQLVASLEKEFESSTTSFSSKLSQMQNERNVLHESSEKTKSDEVLKDIAIVELENELHDLRQRVEKQEKAVLDSETRIREIQVELDKKEMEVRKLECELETKITTSEKTIKNLSEKMERITVEDVKLMENLGKIVEAFDVSSDDDDDDDDEDESVKENVNTILSSPLMKKVEGIHDERSPLRAIN